MEAFRFVHTADLHLGCPFSGLSNRDMELAEQMRESTYRAFERIVDLCIDREVSFLLVAGDVYEGPDRNLRAQIRFREGLARLDRHGIRSFIAHGNHDPPGNRFEYIEWPSSTHFFGDTGVERVEVAGEGGVIASVYGISHGSPDTRFRLIEKFERGPGGGVHIGVLHCNVSGVSDAHEDYAPCSIGELVDAKMDYWALGHIHQPGVLREKDPVIIYPGNPQGRHAGECGPRGCYAVTVGSGGSLSCEFVPVNEYRWEKVEVGIGGLEHVDGLAQRASEAAHSLLEGGKGSIVSRITFAGSGPLHSLLTAEEDLEQVAGLVRERVDPRVTVESVRDATLPEADLDKLEGQESLLGFFLSQVGEVASSEDARLELSGELASFFGRKSVRRNLGELSGEEIDQVISRARVRGADMLLED